MCIQCTNEQNELICRIILLLIPMAAKSDKPANKENWIFSRSAESAVKILKC